jgi:hypothetical protein
MMTALTKRYLQRMSIASLTGLSILFAVGAAGLAYAQQVAVVSQQFNGPPQYRLICYQAGRVIEDQALLDHVVLFADAGGILRRVDYARGFESWHTISIAAGTTCQVDPQG